MRKIPSIDNLLPVLYLKGVSTSGFQDALASILGEGAKGLSATNIVRMKKSWEDDFNTWNHRDLSDKKYAYIWVDGIHFNVRLEDDRCCILVIVGADENGNKELIAVESGYRESTLSWKEMLLSIRHRGLQEAPKLAIGDRGRIITEHIERKAAVVIVISVKKPPLLIAVDGNAGGIKI